MPVQRQQSNSATNRVRPESQGMDLIPAPTGFYARRETEDEDSPGMGWDDIPVIAFDGRTGAALILGGNGYLIPAADVKGFVYCGDSETLHKRTSGSIPDGLDKVAESLHSICVAIVQASEADIENR